MIEKLCLQQRTIMQSPKFCGGACEKGNIFNESVLFREYVDPIKFINGEDCKKRQRYAERKLKKLNKAEA